MGGTSQPASGVSEKLIVQWAGHQYRAINRKTQKDTYIYIVWKALVISDPWESSLQSAGLPLLRW